MRLLNHIFGKKTPNSAAIAAEIEKVRKEHDEALASRGAALAGLSMMDDATHQKAEVEYEAYRRAADRAAARIVDLERAHGDAIATEAEAAKIAAEAAHQKRVEAARNAVEIEGAEHLREYAHHAAAIADVLVRLAEIDEEAKACRVPGIDQTHRKHPDQQASEHRETRPCWVYTIRHAEELGDNKWGYHDEEIVSPATIDANGNPVPFGGAPVARNPAQAVTTPRIEMREIVVGRTKFRPGRSEDSLGSVRLPPAFADNSGWHWPRA
jgi:hypothetical protein